MEKETTTPKNTRIIDNDYLLYNKQVIGKGSFGKVVYGSVEQGKHKGTDICFKIERSSVNKTSILKEEIKIYQYLTQIPGIPKIYHSGSYRNYNYLIMDLLGPSLDKFFTTCNKKFKLETGIYFITQTIDLLKGVHDCGIIHRDIKPNNFLFGKFKKGLLDDDRLYIIDFGLSTRYIEPVLNKHYPYKANCKFVGTPRYASLNTHLGARQSRRDDLESIAYILIYFVAGDLPWQGVKAKTKSEKKEKIKEMKNDVNFEALEEYKSLPPEMFTFLKYCKNLGFYEVPDYKYLKNLLKNCLMNRTLPDKPLFWEWDDLLMTGQYILMKKKYRSLYEGYPFIQFADYLKVIHQKKKRTSPRFFQISLDNDISLVETQCDSKQSVKMNSNMNNKNKDVIETGETVEVDDNNELNKCEIIKT